MKDVKLIGRVGFTVDFCTALKSFVLYVKNHLQDHSMRKKLDLMRQLDPPPASKQPVSTGTPISICTRINTCSRAHGDSITVEMTVSAW